MPRLLDLPDEIIDLIGHHVHDDSSVPFPSFNPHWANDYAVDINKKNNGHFLSYRATCRKIRRVCELGGLHMVVTQWKDITDRIKSAPQRVLSGIRRLHFDCAPPPSPPSQPTNSDTNISLWATITYFLSFLPNLEELVIEKLPLMHDLEGPNSLSRLRNPFVSCLPRLSSLTISVASSRFSRQITRLFVLASPNLRHLKLTRDYGIDYKLSSIFKRWSLLHRMPKPPLETLSVKILGNRGGERSLETIAQLFPCLKVLNFQAHYEVFSRPFESCFTIYAYPPTPTSHHWGFQVCGTGPEGVPVPEPDPLDDSFERLTTVISTMHQLTELDLTVLVHLEPYKPIDPGRLGAPKTRSEQLRHRAAMDAYQDKYQDSCKSIAKAFFKAVPSLTTIHLWSYTIYKIHSRERTSLSRSRTRPGELSIGSEDFRHGAMGNMDGETRLPRDEDEEDEDDWDM